MLKNWTTTQLIAAGALGVFGFLATLPGLLISFTTHIVGSSMLVAGFTWPMFIVITIFLFKKFGAATITFFVYGVLSIPLFGGVVTIMIPVILTGIVLDLVYILFKNESKIAAAVLGSLSLLLLGIIGITMYLLILPALGRLYLPVLPVLLPLASVQGAIGGLLGRFIYIRIKETSVVRRIQG